MKIPFFNQGSKEFTRRVLQAKYIFLFLMILFLKHSIAQTEITTDSTTSTAEAATTPDKNEKEQNSQQPGKALKKYEILSNRITDDSIAQSNAIYEIYKLVTDVTKKLADDSIARAASKQGPSKNVSKPAANQNGKIETTQRSAATFDAGQVFSTFKFVGTQSNTENYTYNVTNSYSLGYQHLITNELFYRVNVGLRHAGASLLFDGVNYNWAIQYFDANVGVGYMLNLWKIKPYLSASPYFGYMLKATQSIGSVNYDLKQNKSLKTTDFGLFVSPGVKLIVSNYVSFYAEYKYILGLQSIETSTTQKTYNRGFSLNLGIAITIEN